MSATVTQPLTQYMNDLRCWREKVKKLETTVRNARASRDYYKVGRNALVQHTNELWSELQREQADSAELTKQRDELETKLCEAEERYETAADFAEKGQAELDVCQAQCAKLTDWAKDAEEAAQETSKLYVEAIKAILDGTDK